MRKKNLFILADIVGMYSEKRISRASAGLSYYMTMTFFPLVICLYYLLGNYSNKVAEALDIVYSFITTDAAQTVDEYIHYVYVSKSPALLVAGLTVLVTSSSAAIRTIIVTIGEMQGGVRYKGIMYFVFSVLFSFAFLAAMYFAVMVIITGRAMLDFINRILSGYDISSSWVWIRFLILAGIMLLIFWSLYRIARQKNDKYSLWPGAVLATVATVGMSAFFSAFISMSTKYSMVYGSIASIILLMLWLYICCQIIYIGAAFNIAIRNERLAVEKNVLTEGRIRIYELREKFYEYKNALSKARNIFKSNANLGKIPVGKYRRKTEKKD